MLAMTHGHVTTPGLGWPTELDPPSPMSARLGWPELDGSMSPQDRAEASVFPSGGDALNRERSKHRVPTEQVQPKEQVQPSEQVWPGGQAAHRNAAPDAGVSRETLAAMDQSDIDQALPDRDPDEVPTMTASISDAARRVAPGASPLPTPASPRVLTVANQKGGVGKTTTAVNLAAALAQAGARVLVIDLDPQGNASTALGIDHPAGLRSVYDVLIDGVPLREVILDCPTVAGLHCAPSTIDLAGAEIELVAVVARENRLVRAVESLQADPDARYDYIFIDCPPSLGLLTVNAFVAAAEVLIPIQCEYYALEGLSQLLKNVDMVRTHLNPALRVSTILLTMFDGRTRLASQVADDVRAHFPDQTLRTTIPRSVRVSEAPSFGETVMTYDPLNSGALAYRAAAAQLALHDSSEHRDSPRSVAAEPLARQAGGDR